MSELLRICDQVSAVAGDISGVIERLNGQVGRIGRLAAQAAQLGRHASSAGLVSVLQEASSRCAAAAAALESAHDAAERFVITHRGGASNGPSPEPTTSGGLDRDPEGAEPRTGSAAAAILAASQSTPAGRAFFNPQDSVRYMSERLAPLPGVRTYDLHGSSHSVDVWDGSRVVAVEAKEFAEIIRADPDWNGEPIRLFACDTGKGPECFAQQLADELGVDVIAPTELAWSNVRGESWAATGHYNDNGELVTTWPPDGKFVTFFPRKGVR